MAYVSGVVSRDEMKKLQSFGVKPECLLGASDDDYVEACFYVECDVFDILTKPLGKECMFNEDGSEKKGDGRELKPTTATIGRWEENEDGVMVFDPLEVVTPNRVEDILKTLAPGDYKVYIGQTRRITIAEEKTLVIKEL